MQSNPSDNTDALWQQMAPVLNDVIDRLREKDRSAIVLRFLKGKDYKQVATALGGSEEAAQMRVSRALEKMRRLLAKRGVVLTAGGLGGLMTAHGVQAAPAGFAASVAATALHGTALAASTLSLVEGTMKFMAWTKVKFAVGATLATLIAYEYHQNSIQAELVASARDNLRGQSRGVRHAAKQDCRTGTTDLGHRGNPARARNWNFKDCAPVARPQPDRACPIPLPAPPGPLRYFRLRCRIPKQGRFSGRRW